MDDHDLTAAYALDALDPDERARYEAHLATCERCREDLQGFWRASGSLARAAGGPTPSPDLRERILAAAREERPNVVPLRPRRARLLPAVAAVAAVALLAVGVWGISVSRELDDAQRLTAVLGDPNARTITTSEGHANLVVTPAGDAALVVRMLAPAPEGKDYEIWVLEDGVPLRAGLFERPGPTLLDRPVRGGQTVAVTLEPDGGRDAPSGEPIFTASA